MSDKLSWSPLFSLMPTGDELLFTVKMFAGAMMALYASLWLGLDNPFWSIASSFVVTQPLASAVRSKALYRLGGTFIGGTAAVAMVPNLVNAPVLLCLAMALWTGLCVYIALLDRSPRSYTFMLAGYTAGIIGFGTVTSPANVFETAVTRVEEISIGIICSTIVATLAFPRPLAPVLARRIGTWVKPGVDWAVAALAGEEDGVGARSARRQLAFEATDIAVMIPQLAYDVSHLQSAVRLVTMLRIYVISLMPVLSSIGERVKHLKKLQGITPELQEVLTETTAWMRLGGPEEAESLLRKILALEHTTDDWPGILRASLGVRLEELVRIVRHARAIRRHVVDNDKIPANPILEAEYIAVTRETHDHKLALHSALAATLAVLAVCTIWVETGWTYGSGAAVMVAVACSFFAAQDDPAPAIAQMLRNALIVVAGSFVYVFLILPKVTTFEALCLALAPAVLIVGPLIARPATFGTGMILGAMGVSQIGFQNGYQGDFVSFANGSLALVTGLTCALVFTRLVRSVGASLSIRRLQRANRLEVVKAANATHNSRALTGLIMDRLGLMLPRLASVAEGADAAAEGALEDLRVGLNLVSLHREQPYLPEAARAANSVIFEGLAAHYRSDVPGKLPENLCHSIDTSIRSLVHDPLTYKNALMILSGLRSVLFPEHVPPTFLPVSSDVALTAGAGV